MRCLSLDFALLMSSCHSYWVLSYQSFKMDCCLTNTDAHVAGGSEDGFIYFWDLVDASVASSFRAHSSVVKSSLTHPIPKFFFFFLAIAYQDDAEWSSCNYTANIFIRFQLPQILNSSIDKHIEMFQIQKCVLHVRHYRCDT